MKQTKLTADLIESSAESVQRGAEALMGLGHSEVEAYKSIAVQLHSNLIEIKAFIARRDGK
jgi:hypothetical protein